MTNAEILTLVFSLAALFLSAVSLWRTSLAPFDLRIVNAPPLLAAQHVKTTCDGQPAGWWIPTLDFGVSFRNLGSRAGLVRDLRISGQLQTESAEQSIDFHPDGMVDFPTYQQTRPDRFESIDQARRRDWYPILLGANEQAEYHLVFQSGSWVRPFSGSLVLRFEACTEKGEWTKLADYRVKFFEDLFEGDTYVCEVVE